MSRLKLPVEPPHRHKTPLPRERLAAVGFVWWPQEAKLICPWPKGPIDWRDEPALLAVMARCDTLTGDRPVWVWADPTREPVLVEATDLHSWLANWSSDRACFTTRRVAKAAG